MTRGAHPRPEARALHDCDAGLPGYCVCKRKGYISRLTCEDRYQAAIQAIIADIRALDHELQS